MKSKTGIYHVMLRGINRQDIFEDEEAPPLYSELNIILILLLVTFIISSFISSKIGDKKYFFDSFKVFENDKHYPHVKWNIIAFMVFLGALLGLAYFVNII